MSNSWKAVCVRGNDAGWSEDIEFVVVNGVATKSKYHGWGRGYGDDKNALSSFENWCKFQEPSKWELIEELTETKYFDSDKKVIHASGFIDCTIDEGSLVKEKLDAITQHDAINPSHYNSTKISAFDVIDDWKLNFYSGNVVKYIQRAGKKENNSELQDLKKAQRYLEKQIELLEGEDK